MAPAHAPLASSSPEVLQLPDVALTYATPANCASVTIAPESELRELLLPSDFHGRLQVVKSDAKKNSGCELRVELTTTESEKKKKTKENNDVFDVATAVDANMVALGKNTYLRSVLGWKELTLEKMALQVDSKRYDVLLNGTGGGDKIALSSDMVLYGNKCSPQLMDEALVLRHVIPSGVDAGSLTIRKSDDVAVAEGHELDCAAVLGVTARAPLLLPGHTEDAMNYLKAFDANLDDTFDVSDKKRMVATVQLYARESLDTTTTELLSQNVAAAVTGGDGGYSSYNAPSKEMALGIVAGFFGLVTMLAAVLVKKRSHEKQCEERYANASKAAQFRRVSIRMASPSSSAHRARDDFGHEEEEEKEYEEYGEDDGLL
ncbi:hypothetical protein Gpo141_00003126 [Globisporangium polare]